MRDAVRRLRPVVSALFLALLIASAIGIAHPDDPAARALPPHCDELAHGECDDVWFCLVACFMELMGLDDYCSQHPDAPQCQ